MCILFFVTNSNPSAGGYKLILAANRDEFYARPALSAAPWKDFPHVMGGRDMETGREGGTWLAISALDRVFKFGALLNITGENKHKDALGRGGLVSKYVAGSLSNDQYFEEIGKSASQYNGFSLVTIEIRYITRHSPSRVYNKMPIYNHHPFSKDDVKPMHLCNAPETVTTEWPSDEVLAFGNCPPSRVLRKVVAGRKQFEEIVHRDLKKEDIVSELMNLLRDTEKHWPDDELLFRAPIWGERLSSVCVDLEDEGYGSR